MAKSHFHTKISGEISANFWGKLSLSSAYVIEREELTVKITRNQLKRLINESVQREKLRRLVEPTCRALGIDPKKPAGAAIYNKIIEKLLAQPDLIQDLIAKLSDGAEAVRAFMKEIGVL